MKDINNKNADWHDPTRRKFISDCIRYATCLSIIGSMPNFEGCSEKTPPKSNEALNKLGSRPVPSVADSKIVAQAKSGDPYSLTRRAVDALGGMKNFVAPGERVMLLPNIAWDRNPDQAANTHPEVVRAVIEMCKECEAKEIGVFCHPCHPAQSTYKTSGIEDAANKAGARVWYVSPGSDFVKVDINGYILKSAKVFKELLSSDRFISIPIAKVHSLTGLTMCYKNLMGAVEDRPILHVNINENLPDLASVITPDLNILDASRILVKNGPTGGSLADVRKPEIVYAGTNMVSVDALGCTLFDKDPSTLKYLKNAKNKGQGDYSLDLIEIREA